MKKILIVDDEINIREGLKSALSKELYDISISDSMENAKELLKEKKIHIIITDVRLLGESGLNLLKFVKKNYPDIEVILMTAYGTIEDAVSAMKDNAYDYITKPIDLKKFRIILRNAITHQELREQNIELKKKLKNQSDIQIIGEHQSIKDIFNTINQIASSNTTVLIYGESGTGKELIAHAIHHKSKRSDKPFIAVNCGAIPENLLESELFGHEQGSFTGAIAKYVGKIEMAHTGTLFLDEISTMSLKSQVNFLRVLEEQKIRRLGGNDLISVDVRIIAASNITLKSMIKDGTFREDLFYRLNVVPINLPPLRDRKSDIPLLIEYYLKHFCEKHERENKTFSLDALDILMNYNWHGNVRELKNIIERLVVTITSNTIEKHHLPDEIRSPYVKTHSELPDTTVEGMEYILIKEALEKFSGHREQCASALGISLRTLQYKLKKYGLK